MQELSGKTAIITGASKGIGEAAARYLGSVGVNVVLAARSENSVTKIASEINASGGSAFGITCDVADYQQVKAVVELAKKTFGSVDILVNNAGLIDPISRIEDSDPAEWDTVIDVNVKGIYYGTRAALPLMKQQGSGVIINISSGAATSALEGWSHYCASKAAAYSLTRCTHREEAENGIRVVGLSPGTVATDMQVSIKSSGINPVSQLDPSVHIPPQWVAKAIAWLATDDAREFDGDDVSLRDENIRQRAVIEL
ncbi:MAG: SDR family oxidoreductase [Pseudomonadota bacterium]